MPDQEWQAAALGLGGNVGDPPAAMASALQAIDAHDACRVVGVSPLYITPPWGKTDQADFFNCCALVETRLEPEALLHLGLAIERDMKRVRVERWGPRTIDIDVLWFDGRVQKTDELELPHPRMTERAFVMLPLADIASNLAIGGRTVREWADSLDGAGIKVARSDAEWWRSLGAADLPIIL